MDKDRRTPIKRAVPSKELLESIAIRRQKREELALRRPEVRAAGLDALDRLLKIAQGKSNQSRVVATFLLSIYNGTRFKFDLTEFRGLDHEIFQDCLSVLALDYQPEQEVHTYFPDGGEIWEKMALDWEITDYFAMKRKGGNQK